MWKWAFVLVCALGVGGSAQATFSVDAYTLGEVVQTGGVFGISDIFDHDSYADTFPDAAATQVSSGNLGIGLGYASARATATFGALSAGASATCAENPDDFPVASATGRARAEIYDTLHLHSPTLANGTPVTFQIQYVLTLNYSSPAHDPSGSFSSAFASLDAMTSTSQNGLHLEFANDNPDAAILSGTLDAQVGEDVTLHYFIDAHPLVSATASSSGLQDGLTGRPQITVVSATPDVYAVTDSGHDYGQLAPEVGATEAELAAAAVLLLWERRARRRAIASPSAPRPRRTSAAPGR